MCGFVFGFFLCVVFLEGGGGVCLVVWLLFVCLLVGLFIGWWLFCCVVVFCLFVGGVVYRVVVVVWLCGCNLFVCWWGCL